MATKTILKNDGVFVYDDYKAGRSALRIRELSPNVPAQNIRRKSVAVDVEAVLVSAAWYDARKLAYITAIAPTFAENIEERDDDYMGYNLSTMIDLIQGRAQTRSLIGRVAAEGYSLNGFKTYKLIEYKEYYKDNSDKVPFEESYKKGGVAKAYLVHPDFYAALTAAPVAGSYVGTGDGTLASSLLPGGAVLETITITATGATAFDVVGSVTGAMGTATVGTVFTSPQVELLITDGTTPFIAGDLFTIESVAA